MSCNGACGKCRGELVLTPKEAEILLLLAQAPFLPIARRPDWDLPAFREVEGDGGAALVLLERKGLVRLDEDIPILNCDYAAYPECSIRGSVALTARGQQAVDLLEGGCVEDDT